MAISILIVEDNCLMGSCLKDWFEDEGYHVTLVSSADTALEMLAANEFQVCISDLNLIGMQGDEFIRIALAAYSCTKFIVLTGLGYYKLDDELRSLGMHDEDVFYKPVFPLGILSNAIRKAIAR
jgi:CheY-like chemotaxis protein